MKRVECDPGICGMPCTIEAERSTSSKESAAGKGKVRIKVQCDCERVVKMANQLVEVDEEVVDEWDPIKPRGESKVCQYAREIRLCAACPVPTAILKAVEAEAELAVAKDAHIRFVNNK
jgi:hypothetical protein